MVIYINVVPLAPSTSHRWDKLLIYDKPKVNHENNVKRNRRDMRLERKERKIVIIYILYSV